MSDGTIPISGLRRPMRSLGIAASGLSAQRVRLDAIADNIANAETTRGVDGQPYRRKVVRLEEVGFQALMANNAPAVQGQEGYGGVRVGAVEEDLSEGPLVYEPGHPDADENGYVRMPNVSITEEMVDLMDTRRLFEANTSVFQAIKSMLRRATQL
ncbi:MAG: flagellar basal body rod protein FlgC [Gemmatimonadota bacterium]|nr:flagellar basal body rod protein FlgC [Gemmatimonadota bacterium]MDH5758243.1 flagellar basal body rod protein FlgC [Gemmatimonadota bacterium]